MTYTEPENMTGLVDIFNYANTVSNNIFGIGLIISLYVIVFMFLRGRGTETSNCMISAGFISVWAAIILFMMGTIDNYHLFITIFVFVISLLYGYLSKD